MRIADIEAAIRSAFPCERILVVDESHLHRGHAGARPYGQSQYRVMVISNAFDGKSRVDRQRLVHAALGERMEEAIHALSLNLRTPEQAGLIDKR